MLLLLMTVFCKTKGALQLPPNLKVPAVLVFGDSIMDTGNNNNNTHTLAKCNFPPYGRDFQGAIPTGRFGNGKVPSDLIAEELGIKDLLPAYFDPNLQPNDLLTGVCFASGGSGYDPLTSKMATAISLSGQIDMFKDYIRKLEGLVGEDRTNFILANSIVLVVEGSNDISNTYFLSHAREVQYDIPTYTDLMVSSASSFLKRTILGGLLRKCAEKYNEAAKLFNSKLAKELASLNQNLPNARVVYLDVYNPLLDIIVNYQNYGFKVGDRGCCGTGKIETAVFCNSLDPTCQNAGDYVFWDGFHPSESVYRKLVPPILQKYMYQFI
ncbi:GDSL esterase/lipase [Vigna angularis]|uniref:GDSL esterase/lipase n=1 Tax=Phaseolus angularis TaxID=3914 RepID=A0A8T0KL40_PHAAN|nr:GDSL esterase/lipase [Vigna angularis]